MFLPEIKSGRVPYTLPLKLRGRHYCMLCDTDLYEPKAGKSSMEIGKLLLAHLTENRSMYLVKIDLTIQGRAHQHQWKPSIRSEDEKNPKAYNLKIMRRFHNERIFLLVITESRSLRT